jgi:hypothetical protein
VEIVRVMEGHRDLEAGFPGAPPRKTDRLCRRARYRRRGPNITPAFDISERPSSSSGPMRIIVGLFPHHRRPSAHHRRVVGAADAPAAGPPLAKVKRALTARA